MEMAERSCGLLRRVSCGSGTPYVVITANGNGRQVTRPPQSELQKRNATCMLIMELQANGNGRQVARPPLQSELRKRNAISVLITELQANGNGRQVTWPPSQSELRKRNATCVFTTEVAANGKGRKQGCDGGRISRAPLRLSF